jgi:hypothetical protein
MNLLAILDDIGVPRDHGYSQSSKKSEPSTDRTTNNPRLGQGQDEERDRDLKGNGILELEEDRERNGQNEEQRHSHLDQGQSEMEGVGVDIRGPQRQTKERGQFVSVMRQGSMHLMALFALAYTGSEVTIGGKS